MEELHPTNGAWEEDLTNQKKLSRDRNNKNKEQDSEHLEDLV